jgi:2-dehydropantoate 2-reductase
VARAEGATVDPEATLAIARSLPPGMRSSMQKDVAQGKPPELDAVVPSCAAPPVTVWMYP